MIPCHICGKDASTGWIKGFVPAPDSQKLALCSEHNTRENRLSVVKAWYSRLEQDISSMSTVSRQKAAPFLHTANIHFIGGGMLSFLCTACTPTEQHTLRIDAPDGSRTYIPLQHIREYSVSPHVPEQPQQSPPPPSRRIGNDQQNALPSSPPAPADKHSNEQEKKA